jgi:hypothetical protein
MKKIIIILLILFVILLYFYTRKPNVKNIEKFELDNDGFCLYNNLMNEKEIKRVKQLLKDKNVSLIKDEILRKHNFKSLLLADLGSGYVFQDYIFIINKSSIHTCHRDANGSFFNSDQKHKSYTLLIFLENMTDSLGIIPRSHESRWKNYINLTNNVITFKCKPGDGLMFDSNLIHVGGINESPNKLRLQFKLCHYNDLSKLDYYNNYHKLLDEDNYFPDWVRHIQKNISCFVPGLADISQNHIKSEAGTNSNTILSNIFSKIFYGNSNFYNLKNV